MEKLTGSKCFTRTHHYFFRNGFCQSKTTEAKCCWRGGMQQGQLRHLRSARRPMAITPSELSHWTSLYRVFYLFFFSPSQIGGAMAEICCTIVEKPEQQVLQINNLRTVDVSYIQPVCRFLTKLWFFSSSFFLVPAVLQLKMLLNVWEPKGFKSLHTFFRYSMVHWASFVSI